MRWFALIAVGFITSCSMMQPAPAPKAPTAQRVPEMMPKAEAQRLLTDRGYTSPALVPSQTYIGGWSGTAIYNGDKTPVSVDKSGNVHA
jgi:hypothetical protein